MNRSTGAWRFCSMLLTQPGKEVNGLARYRILGEGFVHRCPENGGSECAVTVRSTVTRSGEILCSFMTQSGLSKNDFVPTLAISTDNADSWQTRGPAWPHLREAYSITASISRSASGELFFFG